MSPDYLYRSSKVELALFSSVFHIPALFKFNELHMCVENYLQSLLLRKHLLIKSYHILCLPIVRLVNLKPSNYLLNPFLREVFP